MADDIDIEEHDVLDRIKNIFPDIAIKTEVEDIVIKEENDVNDEEYHEIPYRTFPIEFEEENDFKTFPNKIILGTKPSTSQSPTLVFQNKIILGSKTHTPNTQTPGRSEESDTGDNSDLTKSTVLLNDCNNTLADNAHYCEEREILFPTENSFLIAVSKNKAVKSTAKSSLPKQKETTERQNLTCNHCDEIFPNEIALIKHSYELLPGKFECAKCNTVFEKEGHYRKHTATHQNEDTCVMCRICTCRFKIKARLVAHMKARHQTKDLGPLKRVPISTNCNLCDFKLRNCIYYNTHIMATHPKLYNKNANDSDRITKFKCPQCNLCFSSDYSVRIHRAAKHGHVEEPKPASNPSTVSVIPKLDNRNLVFNKCRVIPKSTLYKCNKCAIHFLSCKTALLHWKGCVSKRLADWKCPHCCRIFKLSDRAFHKHQHGITEKFKIVIVTNYLLNKILCRCKKCMVCFDEKTLLTYHGDSCYSDSPSVQCEDCQFWINVNAMTTHQNLHARNFTIKDFILTDYIHVGTNDNEQSVATASVDKEISLGKFTLQTVYFYCPTCNRFMQRNRSVDKHHVGECRKDLPAIICKLCGLNFSKKSLVAHQLQHKYYPKVKLKDLKFANIENDERMNPPFPVFKECRRCNVHFFSALALTKHVCNLEKTKICVYCGESFSDLAFNLHVPFHEYSGNPEPVLKEKTPELIKKYGTLERVWNILFLCRTCDIVTDKYDKVVVHCQDHFCNMESYNVTIVHCKTCDLKFIDNDYYKRHEELHNINNDINKSSFKILEYKYDTLLTDAWLDIFITLTKKQVDVILSKSIYKFTRSVRMEIITDGPSHLTLYQCIVCKLMVPANEVADHSQNQTSTCLANPKKFNCLICKLRFSTKNLKIAHEKLHKGRKLDDTSFRIVQFCAEKKFIQNSSEQTVVKASTQELKFIRCPHCGKLINKQKYKSHVSYHKYYNNYKIKRKVFVKLKSKDPKPKILHNYYICRECNMCVGRKNIKFHYCSDMAKKQCEKCSLWFRSQSFASHYKYHSRYNVNKKNMKIIYFEDGEIQGKQLQKLEKKLSIYQCESCSTCIMKRTNIVRHVCSPTSYQFKCDICELTFFSCRQRPHMELHKIIKFTKKNVNLIKFTPGKPTPPTKEIQPVNSVAEKRKHPISTSPERAHAKKPKIHADRAIVPDKLNYELSDRNWRRFMSIRYYSCTKCKLMFVTGSALIAHEETCSGKNKGIKCEDCGLEFHTSMIKLHSKLQKCREKNLNELCLITIKVTGKSQNNWIYTCRQCDTYTMSFFAVLYHFTKNHKHVREIKKCEECDIILPIYSYNRHLKLHHEKGMNISDLNIAVVEDTTVEALLNNSSDDNETNTPSNTSTDDIAEEPSNSVSTESEIDKTDMGIHTCDICGQNFLQILSLKSHKARGRHGEIQFSCEKCGLNFSKQSLKRHMLVHHPTHKRRKLNAEDPNTSGTSKAEANDSIVESISRIFETQLPATVNHESVASEETNRNKLFKCTQCDVYYPTADTYLEHTSNHRILEPKEYGACNICNLKFVWKYLDNHMKEHRDMTFNIEDLVVTEYQSGKGKARIDTYLAVDRMKSKLVSATASTVKETAKSEEHKIKLYKCSECDVYFLTADACLEHTSDHIALDVTEFIACKMCDLQFPCEYLGKHMKEHRDKHFSIDNLIVAEFQPGSEGVKINTYLAVDRLKSKLVSTTTNFDNEDDKNRKSVDCVDSTTENVMECQNSMSINDVSLESAVGSKAYKHKQR